MLGKGRVRDQVGYNHSWNGNRKYGAAQKEKEAKEAYAKEGKGDCINGISAEKK